MRLPAKVKFTLFLLLSFLWLSACGLTVEKVPLAPAPAAAPKDAQPSPVAFQEIKFAIPTGTPTVAYAPVGLSDFLFYCGSWIGQASMMGSILGGSMQGDQFPDEEWRRVFTESLQALGYDVAGDTKLLFDEDEDYSRARYAVGGRITDLKMNICDNGSQTGFGLTNQNGEAGMTIEWTIFDSLNRRKALQVTTKGYARIKMPRMEGVQLLFQEALGAAIHNLGANAEFHDLVFFDAPPSAEHVPSGKHEPYDRVSGSYAPGEQIALPAQKLSGQPAKGRFEDIVKSVVLVQVVDGHGSGFFIGKDGYILTNAHVVGHANRVRIVTSHKKEELVADVLRVNSRRDAALLKVEKMPKDFDFPVLPMRFEKPAVGEDVYAIGTPAYTDLQDTLTKGIVSAHRFDRQEKQWYIQADVFIYGGNSGGPLLDANGNILGLTVSSYVDNRNGADLSGLNNFIPIEDALDKLGVLYQ